MSESRLHLHLPSRIKVSKEDSRAVYTWRSTFWYDTMKYMSLAFASTWIALSMAPYPSEGFWLHEHYWLQLILAGYALFAVTRALGALVSTCTLTMSNRFLTFSRVPFGGSKETLRMESVMKFYCDERPHAGISVHTLVVILNSGQAIELYYDKNGAFIHSLFEDLEMTKARLS